MGRSKKGRRRGRSRSMFYTPARHKYLGEIVTFKNPSAARGAARELLRLFNQARTRAKKLRIKRAAVLAANRARASAKRKNLSARERRELRQIARIYEQAAKKMKLPER